MNVLQTILKTLEELSIDGKVTVEQASDFLQTLEIKMLNEYGTIKGNAGSRKVLRGKSEDAATIISVGRDQFKETSGKSE
jgi:hypothetical protein